MPDRTRPIRKEICLNEQELSLIRHKMNQLGTRNFGAYARKMLIDGYIVHIDTGPVRAQTAELQKIGVNINQIARSVNAGIARAEDARRGLYLLEQVYALMYEVAKK